MQYNTIEFFAAFLLFLGMYYLLPRGAKPLFLLVASYTYCCTFSAKFSAFMLAITVISYFGSMIVRKVSNKAARRGVFISCLVLTVGFLVAFKYLPWISNLLHDSVLLGGVVPVLHLVAPVGISFYTFRAISFLIEQYTGRMNEDVDFISYATYISFFPQLVSGPIERASNFLPQLYRARGFDYDLVKRGFLLFLFGFFKKSVIADRMAVLVNQVYGNVGGFSSGTYYLTAVVFYAVQIYFDFSGYSDMAIGLCNMMGFHCINNFNRPYFSTSIAEFWRKWHISLSSWFRDYIYFPLGGSRCSTSRWALNIMVVFLVSGLWHGADMTFLVWGGLHGIYQVIGRLTRKSRDKCLSRFQISKDGWFYKTFAMAGTFALVAYAWIFFRANNFADALTVTKGLFLPYRAIDFSILEMGQQDFILSCILVVLAILYELIGKKVSWYEWLQKQKLPIRWMLYMLLMFGCILFGIYGDLSSQSFVYFQF